MILQYHKNVTTFSYEQISKLATLGFKLGKQEHSHMIWVLTLHGISQFSKFDLRLNFQGKGLKLSGKGGHMPPRHTVNPLLSHSLWKLRLIIFIQNTVCGSSGHGQIPCLTSMFNSQFLNC